jgi:hypothetical protein
MNRDKIREQARAEARFLAVALTIAGGWLGALVVLS